MDGAAVVFSCERDDLSGKLVVDVPHDSRFLVVDASDGIDFFLLTQMPAEFFVFPAEMLVLPAVAEEPSLAVGSNNTYRRTKDTQVHAENPVADKFFVFGRDGNLRHPMEPFLRDPHGSQFAAGKQLEDFFRNDSLDGRLLHLAFYHNRKADGSCVHRKILVVVREHRLLEGALSELLVLALGIPNQFAFHDRRDV